MRPAGTYRAARRNLHRTTKQHWDTMALPSAMPKGRGRRSRRADKLVTSSDHKGIAAVAAAAVRALPRLMRRSGARAS